MIDGLLYKSMRETRWSTLLFGLGLLAAEVLLAYLPPAFYKDFAEVWLQAPFVRNALTAIVGTELGESIGPWAIVSIAWAHPIVIALLCAQSILFCTRVPAGEIDRGTIDILLGLPISRTRLFLAESFVWLIWGSLLAVMVVAGNGLGGWFAPPEVRTPGLSRWIVAGNLLALYLAVGGVAWMASAVSDRRGRAVSALFGFLIATFLLNFLAPFSNTLESLSILSLLHYYRPVFIIRDGAWPVGDMLVLSAVGAAFWLAGWAIFARRDICTV